MMFIPAVPSLVILSSCRMLVMGVVKGKSTRKTSVCFIRRFRLSVFENSAAQPARLRCFAASAETISRSRTAEILYFEFSIPASRRCGAGYCNQHKVTGGELKHNSIVIILPEPHPFSSWIYISTERRPKRQPADLTFRFEPEDTH